MPDVLALGLDVVFCGINPGLYTAWAGHHFGRPGNRFWKVLHLAGFTERVLDPSEQRLLLDRRLGVTNLVARPTARADELSLEELRSGAIELANKVQTLAPRFAAVLGVTAYRQAFGRPGASVGLQPEAIGGTRLWVLPNPSGLNAHYQLPALAAAFAQLRAVSRVSD